MSILGTIARRELTALVASPAGWVVAALVLFADSIGFHGIALGLGLRPSSLVLEDLFTIASATTAIAALLLASRTLADDRAGGRLALYLGAPIEERDVVLGKALACGAFALAIDVGLLPELVTIAWRGQIAMGHVAAGAIGLVLVASSASAVGALASSWSRTPAIAALVAAALLGALVLAGPLERVVSPELRGLTGWLAYHHEHVVPFARGLVRLSDVVFHLGLAYVALTLAVIGLRRERFA